MRKHIRIIALLIAAIMVFGLTACGGGNSSESTDESAAAESEAEATSESPSDESEETESQSAKDVLVVYFSATGTTKGVAEKIAAVIAHTSHKNFYKRRFPRTVDAYKSDFILVVY